MLAVSGVILSSVSVASILHKPPDVKVSLSQTDYGKERNLGAGGQSFRSGPKMRKTGKKKDVSTSDLNDVTDESQASPDVLKYETPLSPGEVKYDTELPGALKSPPKMTTGELMLDDEGEVIPPHAHGQKFLDTPESEIENPSQIESVVQSLQPQTSENILKNLQVINGDASQHVGDAIGQTIETLHNMIKMLRNGPKETLQSNLSVSENPVSSPNSQTTQTVSQKHSTSVSVAQSTQAQQSGKSVFPAQQQQNANSSQQAGVPNPLPVHAVPNPNLVHQGGQTNVPQARRQNLNPPQQGGIPNMLPVQETQEIPNAPVYPGLNFHVPQQSGLAPVSTPPIPVPQESDVDDFGDAFRSLFDVGDDYRDVGFSSHQNQTPPAPPTEGEDDFDFGPGFESIFGPDDQFSDPRTFEKSKKNKNPTAASDNETQMAQGLQATFGEGSNFEGDLTAPPDAPLGVNPPTLTPQQQSKGTLKSQLKREIARRLGESSMAQGFAFLFGKNESSESELPQNDSPFPDSKGERDELRGSWTDQFNDGGLFNHPLLNFAAGALGMAIDYVEHESRGMRNRFRRPPAQTPEYGSPLPERPLITDFPAEGSSIEASEDFNVGAAGGDISRSSLPIHPSPPIEDLSEGQDLPGMTADVSELGETVSEPQQLPLTEDILRQSLEDFDPNDIRLSVLGLSQSDLLASAERAVLEIRQSMEKPNATFLDQTFQNDLYSILQGILDGAGERIKALRDAMTLYEEFDQKLYTPLLDEIRKGQNQFIQIEGEIGRLRLQMRDLRIEMNKIDPNFNLLRSQIQESIEQADVEFSQKKKELRDFVEVSEKQFSDYVFAKNENPQLKSILSDLRGKVKKLEDNIHEKERKISKLKSQIVDLSEDLAQECLSWADNFSLFLKGMSLATKESHSIPDELNFDDLERYMDSVIKGYGRFKTGDISVYTPEYAGKLDILENYLKDKIKFFSDLKPENPEKYGFLEIEEMKKLFEIYDDFNLPDMANDLLIGLRIIIEDLRSEYPKRLEIVTLEEGIESDQKEIAEREKEEEDIEKTIENNNEIIARDDQAVYEVRGRIQQKEAEYPSNLLTISPILNDFVQDKNVWSYKAYPGLKAAFEALIPFKHQLRELEEKQRDRLRENKDRIEEIGLRIGNELESEKLRVSQQIQGYRFLVDQFVETYLKELESISVYGLLEKEKQNSVRAAMLMKILDRGNPIGENIFDETQTRESQNKLEFESLNLQRFQDFMQDWLDKLGQFESTGDLLKSGSSSSSSVNVSSGHTVKEVSDPDGTFRRGLSGDSHGQEIE